MAEVACKGVRLVNGENRRFLEGLGSRIASAGVPFRARGYDEWGHRGEETHHIEEVTAKADHLSDREVDVELAAKKQTRPPMETSQASEIEHKNGGKQRSNIEPLISRYYRDQMIAGWAGTVARTCLDQAQIVDEKHPTDCGE
jgi:hypothetical protein